MIHDILIVLIGIGVAIGIIGRYIAEKNFRQEVLDSLERIEKK